MIHDRIRRARVLKGYTLEVLAQRIGNITKQALSKFESGQTVPNSTRLLQLAKALELSPEYFFRADVVELAPLEFRKLAKMPKYRQEQVTERIREHLERYIALENCFEHADSGGRSASRPLANWRRCYRQFDRVAGRARDQSCPAAWP
jgi:transcriptional regulator with XRE-family HTH domain